MLRITTHDNPDCLTFQLEGKLAGPWVRELEDCWQKTLAGPRRPVVRVDLRGVTFLDAAGKEFLRRNIGVSHEVPADAFRHRVGAGGDG